jgi:dienelactone hydrolase
MRSGLVLSAILLCAGCGGTSSHPVITATPASGLLDAPPRIRVSGVGDGAVLRASTVDEDGRRWTSTTPVAALHRDPTRPLWTLSHGAAFFGAPVSGFAVRLDLVQGGRSVAHTTIARRWTARGVRHAPVRNGLYGEEFDPPGAGRRPAALVIGGSDGGLTTAGEAALLASHGHPAMALAYFREPGLPRMLKDIPLEYFSRALRRLRTRPNVDPRRVAVIGVSRGAEAALLIGATYPRLVHGVVALVPSNVVNPSPDGRSTAWTLRGRPVPQIRPEDFGDPDPVRTPAAVIRAERITGPILTAAGGLDELWPSYEFTEALHQRLTDHRFAYAHRDLRFENAGHLLGAAVPYLPTMTTRTSGGSAAADEAAKAALWPRILDFMRSLGGG